ESVHIHPDYAQPNENLLKGDLAPLMNFFKSRSDIALIKLTSTVSGVEPINIYSGKSEKDKTITVYGRGATGDGLTGENPDTKSLRVMNRFQNIVERAEDNWLAFKFDEPANALPLEGMHGSGDSGGASVIFQDGVPFLVGLSSWQLGKRQFKPTYQ
ncbi:MAG: trypsin-like serine protease, partial [Pseudomonadota bacterium]